MRRDVEDDDQYDPFFDHGQPIDPGLDAGPAVTTFIFRVRNVPAALYKALGGFATNGVNMMKLESYMVGGAFSATMFYADIDGHPEDTSVCLALEELGFFSREVRILGVYLAHPRRCDVVNYLLRPSPRSGAAISNPCVACGTCRPAGSCESRRG